METPSHKVGLKHLRENTHTHASTAFDRENGGQLQPVSKCSWRSGHSPANRDFGHQTSKNEYKNAAPPFLPPKALPRKERRKTLTNFSVPSVAQAAGKWWGRRGPAAEQSEPGGSNYFDDECGRMMEGGGPFLSLARTIADGPRR